MHIRPSVEDTERPKLLDTAEIVNDSKPRAGRVRLGLILALGVLSILVDIVFVGPLLGIPAWVMAHKDLRRRRADALSPDHKGLLVVGMVLGIIGTFGAIPSLAFFFLYRP